MKNLMSKTGRSKIISILLSMIMLLGIITTIPMISSAQSQSFNYNGFKVDYNITGSWADNQNISITITNTGNEPIRNWALQYDPKGTINGVWNGEIHSDNVIKSVMHNSDIAVGSSVSFGYTLMGVTGIPDSFSLCNYRVEKETGYTVSLNTMNDWGSGFTGIITITNTTNKPIMAWELSFTTNFNITHSESFIILENKGTYYKATGAYNGNIAANSSVSFQFNASSALNAAISDVLLTEVIVSSKPIIPDEPDIPDACAECNEYPCVCPDALDFCKDCNKDPCICVNEPDVICNYNEAMRYGGIIAPPTTGTSYPNFINANAAGTSGRGNLEFNVLDLISDTAIKANEIYGFEITTWGSNTENRQVFIEVNTSGSYVSSPRFHAASAPNAEWLWAVMAHGNTPNNGGRTEQNTLTYMNKYGGNPKAANNIVTPTPFVSSETPARFDVRIRPNDNHASLVAAVTLLDVNGEALGTAVYSAQNAAGTWERFVSFVSDCICGKCEDNGEDEDDIIISYNNAELDANDIRIIFDEEDYAESIKSNITLPLIGERASVITWASDKSDYITSAGQVTRPNNESVVVNLTATVTNGADSAEKTFSLNVVKNFKNEALQDNNFEDLYDLNLHRELEFSYNTEGDVSFIDGKFTNMLIESPQEAVHSLNSVKTILGIEDPEEEFYWVQTSTSGAFNNFRLQQVYDGVTVFGKQIVITTSKTGEALSMNCKNVRNIDIDVTDYDFTNEQAYDIIRGTVGGNTELLDSELYIYALFDTEPLLAWKIRVEGQDNDGEYIFCDYFVCAVSGEIVDRHEFIYGTRGTGVTGIAKDVHGENKEISSTQYSATYFELRDSLRKINIYDANNSVESLFSKLNNDSTIVTNTNGSGWKPVEVSAMYNMSAVYDSYMSLFKRNSLNDGGMPINVYLNYNRNNERDGAFWLWWDYNGGKEYAIVFTDVNKNKHSHAGALDVVAHEYTHGIGYFEAGFIRTKNNVVTASVDEAYADILGILIKSHYLKKDPHWCLGSDSYEAKCYCKDKNSNGFIRNLKSPKINHYDQIKDSHSAHDRSEVLSHVAYKMYDSGLFSVDELTKIWYESLKVLTSEADFWDSRAAVLSSMRYLELNNIYRKIDTAKKAFDDVGITRDKITIELTWDRTSNLELNAHLIAPVYNIHKDTGTRFIHLYDYLGNDIYREFGYPLIRIDSMSISNQQTISIFEPIGGTYKLYVHDYQNNPIASGALSRSGATVNVYRFSSGKRVSIKENINVPSSLGNFWHVLEFDILDNNLTITDKISSVLGIEDIEEKYMKGG